MKVRQNEKGYALVIVLLLIVLVISMSAVFLRGSISNARQEQQVDKNHLAVVIAEMGVDYYVTSFTNSYYEVKHTIWEEKLRGFQKDMSHAKTAGERKRITDEYNKSIQIALSEAFSNVRNRPLPPDVHFSTGTSEIHLEVGSNQAIVSGISAGDYRGDAYSELEFVMNFDVPSVSAASEEGNGNSSADQGSSIVFPSYITELLKVPPVQRVSKISIGQEQNVDTAKIKTKVKKDDITLPAIIKGYLQSVTLKSEGNIVSSYNMDENHNVNIFANGSFETKHMQGNPGPLSITALNNIEITNGNYYGNWNTMLHSNGNIVLNGQFSENKGTNKITAGNDFVSKNFVNNTDIDLLTGNSIKMAMMQGNQNGTYRTGGDFDIDHQIQDGTNQVLIAKNDLEIGGTVINNKDIKLYGGNGVKTGILQGNNPIEIFSGNELEVVGGVSGNRNAAFYSKGDYKSGKIQDNYDMIQVSLDEVEIQGDIYGNRRLKLYAKEDFKSGKIQDNKFLTIYSKDDVEITDIIYGEENLTIIAAGDFKAKRVNMRTNSKICVGDEFEVDGSIETDSTSFIYVKKKEYENKNKNVIHLPKEQWEAACKVDDFPDEDEQPVPEPDGSSKTKWVDPRVTVDYL